MSKKEKKKNKQEATSIQMPEIQLGKTASFFGSFKVQAIIIALIGFGFYINSVNNKYALDDGIVIEKNKYVQQGFAGIGKILSTDAYASYYEYMNSKDQLSGGRYRPLSIVTFAIEHQFFGEAPGIRHFFNVIFYVLSLLLLLYFLHRFLFANQPNVAFIATLLFAIHPIHTEVVANIKSRDEIMSLLFILLTFILAFLYHDRKKTIYLAGAVFAYFLALLSKEYAITLIVFIPLLLYLSRHYSIGKSVLAGLPFLVVALLYIAIRFSIVVLKTDADIKPDVLNDPFMFAKGSEALATKIYILSKYLKLLFWPHPLSADYAWKTIPYETFGSIKVLWSLLLNIGILVWGLVLLKRRHILAFAVGFYAAHLLMVSNLVMALGATMGERLAYHSSLGFCMAMAYGLMLGVEKIKQEKFQKAILFSFLAVVVLLAGFKTVERNTQWKSDATLFIHDVEVVPNSIMVNGNAGARYIDLADKPENKAQRLEMLNKGIACLSKAISMHPDYVAGFLNRGIGYYKLEEYEKAELDWNEAKRQYPSHPLLKEVMPILAVAYLNKGLKYGQEQKYTEAIAAMEHAKLINPNNPEIWYNLGGAYFTIKDYIKAKECWQKCLELKPDHADAKRGFEALSPQ